MTARPAAFYSRPARWYSKHCSSSTIAMLLHLEFLSGRILEMQVTSRCTVNELRFRCQDLDLLSLGQLPGYLTLREVGIKDRDRLQVARRRVAEEIIASTLDSFALVRADGSVVTWGCHEHGGRSWHVQDQLFDVIRLVASDSAFAALRADGHVVTWGNHGYGGDSRHVQQQLVDVTRLAANQGAFAAVLASGRVVTWGNASRGGNSKRVQSPSTECAERDSYKESICGAQRGRMCCVMGPRDLWR